MNHLKNFTIIGYNTSKRAYIVPPRKCRKKHTYIVPPENAGRNIPLYSTPRKCPLSIKQYGNATQLTYQNFYGSLSFTLINYSALTLSPHVLPTMTLNPIKLLSYYIFSLLSVKRV